MEFLIHAHFYLEFIGQHFLQLLLTEHVETLLQHLPPVTHVSGDGLEWQAEVKPPLLDVAADPVQLGVGELIFGVLLQGNQRVTQRLWLEKKNICKPLRVLEVFSFCYFTGNQKDWKLVFCFNFSVDIQTLCNAIVHIQSLPFSVL